MRSRIDFFYVEAGGGHKAAATALKLVIEKQGLPWEVRLVNVNHVLGSIDFFKSMTGRGVEEIYNAMLKNGWTVAAPYLMPGMHAFIWLLHGKQVRLLEEYWKKDPPDMVVSLIPHFNRALKQALDRVNPKIPFVTILTDFADVPPHVWLERQKQYVICGTDKAVQQAYSFDHAPDRVFRVSGMILRPSFYDIPAIDRDRVRKELGLEPGVPTALVLFGGEGSNWMEDIAKRLAASGLKLQLILMYGKNEELGRRLRALKLPIRCHVQGFTSEVPKFMQVADFMLGKPGPGSISEALAMKLPVIVDCNAWTLPQERYNTEWLLENKLGLVVKNWRHVVPAVTQLLAPGVLEEYKARAAKVDNRAIFEIPELLCEIMRRGA